MWRRLELWRVPSARVPETPVRLPVYSWRSNNRALATSPNTHSSVPSLSLEARIVVAASRSSSYARAQVWRIVRPTRFVCVRCSRTPSRTARQMQLLVSSVELVRVRMHSASQWRFLPIGRPARAFKNSKRPCDASSSPRCHSAFLGRRHHARTLSLHDSQRAVLRVVARIASAELVSASTTYRESRTPRLLATLFAAERTRRLLRFNCIHPVASNWRSSSATPTWRSRRRTKASSGE